MVFVLMCVLVVNLIGLSHLNLHSILQTTWDRPGLDGEMNESILNDSVQSNDRSDQSESVVESDDDYSSSVENTLPPNWIGKEQGTLA